MASTWSLNNVKAKWLAWVLISTLIIGGVVYYIAPQSHRWPPLANRNKADVIVVADESTLDFGEVWAGNAFVWPVKLRNLSSEEVAVSSITVSCGCVSAEPSAFTIPKNGEFTIQFQIDLTKQTPTTGETWKHETLFVPNLKNHHPSQTQAWRITGYVQQLVNVSQTVLDFGEAPFSEMRSRKARVEVTPVLPIKDLAVDFDGSKVQATLVKPAMPSGTAHLEVQSIADKTGALSGSVLLKIFTADRRFASWQFKLQGTILNGVVSSPDQLLFGARKVGEVVEETVTILSTQNEEIELLDYIVESGAPSEISVSSVQGRAVKAHVKHVVQNRGQSKSLLSFIAKERKTGKSFQVRVPLSVYGVDSTQVGSQGALK